MLAAAALLLAACGGSSSTTETSTALTRAAYVSSAATGYKAAMRLRETVGSLRIVMTGTGSFTPADHTGSLIYKLNAPAAVGSPIRHPVRMKAVYSGTNVYFKMPALTTKLPTGKPWVSLQVSKLAKAEGIPGLSSLLSGTSSLNDPGRYLAYLRATSSQSVKNLGPATIDGVKTTHYHAEIELSKLIHAVPASARPGVAQLVAALQKQRAETRIPVDAWIDGAHLVRRLAMKYTQRVASISQSARVSLRMDFVDYGPQPKPRIPPPSHTTSLLALLHGPM